jgi:dTDP-4-amino-4,6-dideoxygalactose transaminase
MKVDPAYDIPFNRPTLVGRENEYMARAVQAGHISGDGAFTRECHTLLEKEVGVPQALLTTSCTHALEMAALLLELGSGDEVIMPSFTFVSMANAVALRGARPVFVDVRPDTLNLDERLIEAAITEKTRAIFLVHYAGVACEMDAIQAIADRGGLPLVEDNAHGLFARYKRRWAPSARWPR